MSGNCKQDYKTASVCSEVQRDQLDWSWSRNGGVTFTLLKTYLLLLLHSVIFISFSFVV